MTSDICIWVYTIIIILHYYYNIVITKLHMCDRAPGLERLNKNFEENNESE